mmetsp:Transcript_81740/g.198101  ORF Transcript_81740/g.198101 Transcript_81740/m.198101 type:complete len:299 (-) Transcript_81740:61-957(-)
MLDTMRRLPVHPARHPPGPLLGAAVRGPDGRRGVLPLPGAGRGEHERGAVRRAAARQGQVLQPQPPAHPRGAAQEHQQAPRALRPVPPALRREPRGPGALQGAGRAAGGLQPRRRVVAGGDRGLAERGPPLRHGHGAPAQRPGAERLPGHAHRAGQGLRLRHAGPHALPGPQRPGAAGQVQRAAARLRGRQRQGLLQDQRPAHYARGRRALCGGREAQGAREGGRLGRRRPRLGGVAPGAQRGAQGQDGRHRVEVLRQGGVDAGQVRAQRQRRRPGAAAARLMRASQKGGSQLAHRWP